MIILISIFIAILSILFYIIFNLLKKLEIYEQNIEEFYSSLSIVLHTMRALDEKKMFETDDEVGEVFGQLTDIISMLRPILYGQEQDDKEKN
jgi:hypothetical protein